MERVLARSSGRRGREANQYSREHLVTREAGGLGVRSRDRVTVRRGSVVRWGLQPGGGRCRFWSVACVLATTRHGVGQGWSSHEERTADDLVSRGDEGRWNLR